VSQGSNLSERYVTGKPSTERCDVQTRMLWKGETLDEDKAGIGRHTVGTNIEGKTGSTVCIGPDPSFSPWLEE
jgi:hypothetical protein